MSNFDAFQNLMNAYLNTNGISLQLISNLHDASLNNSDKNHPVFVYEGEHNLNIIDMDLMAKKGYKVIKRADGADNIINTADAFLISSENKWFFIEFKDSEIKAENSGLKNNVLKKAYSNWYMILDILYSMHASGILYDKFNYENPAEFARNHVYYVLVCSEEKNPRTYQQIKNCDLIGEKYTPPFMQRLKTYLFKDAYIYTNTFFERKFARCFTY